MLTGLWRKSPGHRRGAQRRRGGVRGGFPLPAKDGGSNRGSDSTHLPVGRVPRISESRRIPVSFPEGRGCGGLFPRAAVRVLRNAGRREHAYRAVEKVPRAQTRRAAPPGRGAGRVPPPRERRWVESRKRFDPPARGKSAPHLRIEADSCFLPRGARMRGTLSTGCCSCPSERRPAGTCLPGCGESPPGTDAARSAAGEGCGEGSPSPRKTAGRIAEAIRPTCPWEECPASPNRGGFLFPSPRGADAGDSFHGLFCYGCAERRASISARRAAASGESGAAEIARSHNSIPASRSCSAKRRSRPRATRLSK